MSLSLAAMLFPKQLVMHGFCARVVFSKAAAAPDLLLLFDIVLVI
jgi:hypothetical protein